MFNFSPTKRLCHMAHIQDMEQKKKKRKKNRVASPSIKKQKASAWPTTHFRFHFTRINCRGAILRKRAHDDA